MRRILFITGVVCLLAPAVFAAERSMLARVTVYWASGGAGSDSWTKKHQTSTGVRLRYGHCAVDPRRIPYGSKVIFPDGTLTAVDTGKHVRTRHAARRTGRSNAERNAIVVDRFFETKSQALAWSRKHPHFMTVKVVSPNESKSGLRLAQARASTEAKARIAATAPRREAEVSVSSATTNATTPLPVLRNSVRTVRNSAPVRIVATSPAAMPSPAPAVAARPTKPLLAPHIEASNKRIASKFPAQTNRGRL